MIKALWIWLLLTLRNTKSSFRRGKASSSKVDCTHIEKDRMMLATSCVYLRKLMLRTDFKTEDLRLWCLILSSNSTLIVSPCCWAMSLLLAMHLSQLLLLAWRTVHPIMIIQNRLVVYPSLLILQGSTQILALPQSLLFKTVLRGVRNPWALRLARLELGKLLNLSQIPH